MAFSSGYSSIPEKLMIVTVDSPQQAVLRQKAENIQPDELPLANLIADQLVLALQPYQPAAGLAAPQIGISKSVFIFSYDRDPKHLEVVINPEFTPIGDKQIEGWEGCLSVITNGSWKLAKLPRYEKIHVTYLNSKGEEVSKDLTGFSAKVFQHEHDHLQGVCNIDRPDAIVNTFATKEDMESFLDAVKRDDAKRYVAPK